MSNIQVNYTGDGATVLYTITFDYLRRAHVKASINGSNTIDFTFANDTTLQFNSAPANGAAISLFRETSADAVDNTFFPNSSISSESLNDNFLQTLLVSEEAREIAAEAQLGNLVPGSIGTAALTDGAVTSVKIANNTIVNEDINASAAIADTKLATIATAGKVSNSATTATSSNTVSAIVARDGSGNFSAGTITADLTGTASAIADNIVTSAKIVDGTIVDGDISATAEIAVSKLADGAARQLLQTDAAGTGVEWTDNVDVPGTLDVTGASTLDSTLVVTGDVTVPNLNGGPLAGFRNAIINGNFDIWQRGTSFTGSEYGADRWDHARNGTTHTATRQPFTVGQTDVPNEPTYFCRTVVSTVAGAGNYAILVQKIEDVRTFAGQQVTVSFWAKADATKNISVELNQFFGTGGSPSAKVTAIGTTKVSIGTTFQKVTVTATLPSISGKTIGTNNDTFFSLQIWFDAGSDFNARTDTLGQQSGTFEIAQVQIEPGSVATPFEQRPIGTELALCQRYYESQGITAIVMYPPVSNNVGNIDARRCYVTFNTTKRAAPTVTVARNQGLTSISTFSYLHGFSDSGSQGAFLETTITSWTASIEL